MAEEQMELVTLGGKTFTLPYSYNDVKRRKEYFGGEVYKRDPEALALGQVNTMTGGFMDHNSDWLDFVLQTGGGKFYDNEVYVSAQVHLTGQLLKDVKAIFDAVKLPSEISKDSDFYIPIVDLWINADHLPADFKWHGRAKLATDYLKQAMDGKGFQQGDFASSDRESGPYLSRLLITSEGSLLDDVAKAFCAKLLGVDIEDFKNHHSFTNTADDLYSEVKIITTPKNNLFRFYKFGNQIPLILGKQIKGSTTVDSLINGKKLILNENKSIKIAGTYVFLKDGNVEYSTLTNNTRNITNSLLALNITPENTVTTTIIPSDTATVNGFLNGSLDPDTPHLKSEEWEILKALGFDYKLLEELASHLPDFFDNLPSCSTDTSMMLKRECENSYFILWSIMFKAQQKLQSRMEDNKAKYKFLPDIESGMTRQTTRALFDLHKKPPSNLNEKDILALFKIIRREPFTAWQVRQILNLFLISRQPTVSDAEDEIIQGILSFARAP